MKRFLVAFLLLLLVACTPEVTSTPEVTETVTVTVTATSSPTITPTVTSSPTVDPVPSPTREIIGTFIRLTANANVRSAPSSTASVMYTANPSRGDIEVVGKNGDWLRTFDGWIFNGSWVTFSNGSLSDLNEIPAPTPIPPPQNINSRIGYNTLEVYDEAYYINHLRIVCPRYNLVMDNLSLAVRVSEALQSNCNTRIIHRDWHPSDGSEYQVRTPQEFVARWVQQGYPNIIRYTTNEVSCYDNCEAYVAHEVEIARLAREAGFTVVLGNTGVGKFSPQSVLRGVFDPLVEAANEYGHLLGFHEYTGVCLCFGFGQMATEWLADPARVQPEQWANNINYDFVPFSAQGDPELFGVQQMQASYAEAFVALAAKCEGNLPPYWHMGRSYWILLHYECETGETNKVDIVHTEWGWDRLDDISSVVNPLQAQYGMEEFGFNLRGWQSLGRLWTELYWTDQTVAQSAIEQIMFTTNLYEDNHFFLLFAWTDNCNRDWFKAGFGFGNCSSDGDAQEFHSLLENFYR